MAKSSVSVTCGFLILAVFVAGGQCVCDGPGAEACYSSLATAMASGNKEDMCEAMADPEAMKTCVKNKIADCGAQKQEFQGKFEGMLMGGLMQCSPGCETLVEKMGVLQQCGVTFAQKASQATADKNEDQMCSDYDTLVACMNDAIGTCTAVKDKIEEQTSQYASMVDEKCPASGTVHVGPTFAAIVVLAIVSYRGVM